MKVVEKTSLMLCSRNRAILLKVSAKTLEIFLKKISKCLYYIYISLSKYIYNIQSETCDWDLRETSTHGKYIFFCEYSFLNQIKNIFIFYKVALFAKPGHRFREQCVIGFYSMLLES